MNKQEIFKSSAHRVVDITKTAFDGRSTTYRTAVDENNEEVSELDQWIRVISEYKLIKEKTSKLSRRDRDEVTMMVDILVEGDKIILNEDYSLKSFFFNGKEIALELTDKQE